jgi:N-acetylglucosaminyldiphosphoundecaprenol N-acetyl-beta-D-mannosaminyltransferase
MVKRIEKDILKYLSRIESEETESFVQKLKNQPPRVPKFVWTMNLSHVREVVASPDLFEFLDSSAFIVADGWPVKYLVKMFEAREVNRVPGVDIVKSLLASGIKFCVIGSNQSQVLKTLEKHDFAVSELTFTYDKFIDVDSKIQIDEIIQLLFKFKPQFIFLALGFPKQELLFERIQSKNPQIPAYFLGIGGSFQLLSGEKLRAPRKLQDLGLEWLWRLSQDPKRLFERYFADIRFIISLVIIRRALGVRATLGKWTRLS